MVIITFYIFLPSLHDEAFLHYAKHVFYAPVMFLKKKAYLKSVKIKNVPIWNNGIRRD